MHPLRYRHLHNFGCLDHHFNIKDHCEIALHGDVYHGVSHIWCTHLCRLMNSFDPKTHVHALMHAAYMHT